MLDSTIPVVYLLDMLGQAGIVPTTAAFATHRREVLRSDDDTFSVSCTEMPSHTVQLQGDAVVLLGVVGVQSPSAKECQKPQAADRDDGAAVALLDADAEKLWAPSATAARINAGESAE